MSTADVNVGGQSSPRATSGPARPYLTVAFQAFSLLGHSDVLHILKAGSEYCLSHFRSCSAMLIRLLDSHLHVNLQPFPIELGQSVLQRWCSRPRRRCCRHLQSAKSVRFNPSENDDMTNPIVQIFSLAAEVTVMRAAMEFACLAASVFSASSSALNGSAMRNRSRTRPRGPSEPQFVERDPPRWRSYRIVPFNPRQGCSACKFRRRLAIATRTTRCIRRSRARLQRSLAR